MKFMNEQSRKTVEEIEKNARFKTGIGKIERGECETGGLAPSSCILCPYGHILECHYPMTCEEADCGHYREQLDAEEYEEAEPEGDETTEKLRGSLCCCGEDHTIRQGGNHINVAMLKKLAKWPWLTAVNVLVPESMKYPLANAVVCERCLREKREIKYAMAGTEGKGGVEYHRVLLAELEEPAFYWPDHHPDIKAR